MVSAPGIASPVSTGGAGSDFERKVGASFLVSALLRSACRGFASGTVTDVQFQRQFEDEPADDIKVLCNLPSGQAKLTLQVKRDLTFGEKDPIFDEVITALWETFKDSEFNKDYDRFGIAIALESKRLTEFRSALAWARLSTSSADFFARMNHPRLSNKNQRNFTELLRKKVTRISGLPADDDTVWSFMSHFELLTFDFETSGSRDELFAITILRYHLPPDRAERAAGIFAKVVDYAAEGHRAAGSFDNATHTAALARDGEILEPPQDCRRDLSRLAEHSRLILQGIVAEVGGLHLPRQDVRQRLEVARSRSSLLIAGAPGVGKSAFLREMAEGALISGGAFVLSGDRVSGGSWDAFAATLQLERPLRDLLGAVELVAPTPLLFVDGIDRAIGGDAREVLNDLLREIRSQRAARQWTLLFTCRDANVTEVYAWLCPEASLGLELQNVPGLSDDELAIVADEVPRLAPLMQAGHLKDVLRIPFFLRLLADPRAFPAGSLDLVATENDVARVWWDRIVGPDRSRQQLLLDFGERLLAETRHDVFLQVLAAEAVAGLEADTVLVRDARRDAFRFCHDLFEDWVYLRLLRQRESDVTAFLRSMGEPLALQRAVQLFGAALLEEDETGAMWAAALKTVEEVGALLPRWRQALLTAPFASTRGAEILSRAKPTLLQDGALRLRDLLRALRTVAVYPNLDMLPIAIKIAASPEEAASLLYVQPLPQVSVWSVVLPWIVAEARAFPLSVRSELVQVLALWQTQPFRGSPYRVEIAQIADEWLRAAEAPPSFDYANHA